jgi:hypothetical protein
MGKPKTPEEEKIYQELIHSKYPTEVAFARSHYKDETTKRTWQDVKKELEILKKEF